VLAERFGREVNLAKIIHGDDHATFRLKTTASSKETRKRTEDIATLISSNSPPDRTVSSKTKNPSLGIAVGDHSPSIQKLHMVLCPSGHFMDGASDTRSDLFGELSITSRGTAVGPTGSGRICVWKWRGLT
jgi:hypothetical protein